VQELPGNNMLNTPVTSLPVHPMSDTWIGLMTSSDNFPGGPLYCDFNSNTDALYGIPYTVVQPGQGKLVPVSFDVADESDPGPYLMPANNQPHIEGSVPGNPDANGELGTTTNQDSGTDGHVLVLDVQNKRTYELIGATPNGDGSWHAYAGAIFDLTSNLERTPGITSACAYGYSLLIPLAKYEEVKSGAIKHAISINTKNSSHAYVWPANHQAGGSSSFPPMGTYMRLKASSAARLIPQAPPQSKIILQALATYGAITTQNSGSYSGFLNGDSNAGWDPTDLHWIKDNAKISDLEVIDVSSLEISPSTAQASQGSGGASVPANAQQHTSGAARAK
jgi:hypothetical protein